jgi:excisionase family DNA binding protein
MADATTENEEVLLWTLEATADVLSVHPKTVSRLAKSGQLSAIYIGRSIRIEKQSVYHFIESQRQYNHSCVESAVRDPTGERICRIEIPKNAKMEVPTKVRTTRSASQQMVNDYNALLGRKP